MRLSDNQMQVLRMVGSGCVIRAFGAFHAFPERPNSTRTMAIAYTNPDVQVLTHQITGDRTPKSILSSHLAGTAL